MEFISHSNLHKHTRLLETKSELRSYSCDLCEMILCFEIAVRKHKKQMHSDDKDSIHCDECTKIFYSKQNLNRHKKACHLFEKFHCKECDKVFSYRQTLNEHNRAKHNNNVPND